MNKQTVIVRIDTQIQVELPACGECGNEPCPMCRDEAVRAAVSVVRGSWSVDSTLQATDEEDGWVDVYSDCSEDDVIEVWVE
jgi:hypothetical protein